MLFSATKEQTVTAIDRGSLFESLIRQTNKQAYSLAYRLTGNTSEAEDLVQESYVRAYRFFHRYDSSLPFTSWLYRIMTNAHIDAMRKKNRLKTLSLEQGGVDGTSSWDFPSLNDSPDAQLMESSLEEPLQNALNAMTPEFRMAVLLSDVEGMAYEEIAEVMKTSVGTVRSRIHRGRRQLRMNLTQVEPNFGRRVADVM